MTDRMWESHEMKQAIWQISMSSHAIALAIHSSLAVGTQQDRHTGGLRGGRAVPRDVRHFNGLVNEEQQLLLHLLDTVH